MKSTKKFFSLFIVAMFVFAVLSACSASSDTSTKTESGKGDSKIGKLDPKHPTKITFYSYSLSYPTMKPGMEHLIKEFNDTVGKEKGVIVEGIPDPTFQQYKADIAAGKEVDVIQHTFP